MDKQINVASEQKSKPKFAARIWVLFRNLAGFITVLASLVAIIGFYIEHPLWPSHATPTPTVTATSLIIPATLTSTPAPTPIGKGTKLLEITFNEIDDGHCNDYDPNILGYESHQYYIQPLSPAGYISNCKIHENWQPKGSLEVKAYPTGDTSIFGYGVMFGWDGSASGTTDACYFGVVKESEIIGGVSPGYHQVTKAKFLQRIDGVNTSKIIKLDMNLDTQPHTVRLVLLNENVALGYLDDTFVASYEFQQCGEGSLGLIAWGSGDTKVFFDDFILYALP